MKDWDKITDVLVVGSGGGGMTAALTAKDKGNDALIIEKGSVFGGSTAMSGGAIWVPVNHLMAREGMTDSPEEALTYLKVITKGRVPDDRLRAYIESSREMVKYLEEKSQVCFKVVPGYSDYYPAIDGGKKHGGRTIEPIPISGFKLGKLWHEQRLMPNQGRVFGRILLTAYEFHLMFDTSIKGKLQALKFISAYFLNPLRVFSKREDSRLTLGSALIARLRLSVADKNIPLWLKTRAVKLITKDNRVIGVEAEKEGQKIRIKANKGVVLAAGGFDRNLGMRQKYHRQPVSDQWTVGSSENTGDAINMGIEAGAALGFMDEAWWMSTTPVPGSDLPYMILVERALAGSVMVNSKGKRFTNEAGPYIDVVNAQYKNHSETGCAIPAYLIADKRYMKKYPLGPIMPGASVKKHIDDGFLKAGQTLEELAEKCGIDPKGLSEEIKKYNEHAKTGKDPDFDKGVQPIDRYYSDASVKPNSCVAPVDKPPFYAIKVWPGDLGTKGGLNADAHARVLREDGTAIAGLYATGNCSASVMGDTYAGAGATIGPSMTFGYIAAKHASGA